MPVIHLHLAEGLLAPAQEGELLQQAAQVYARLLEAPVDRIRAILHVHALHRVCVAGQPVTADPATQAPFFECLLLAGRSEAMRHAVLAAFTDLLAALPGVDRSRIRGFCHEVPPANWAIAGQPASVARAAEVAARQAAPRSMDNPASAGASTRVPVVADGSGSGANLVPDPSVVPGATLHPAAVQRLLAAALAQADAFGIRICVAVVEPSGTLAGFVRMPGAFGVSTRLAQDKACTAASIGLPLDRLAQVLEAEAPRVREGLCAQPGFTLVQGGLPVWRRGLLVGAIGVSGGSEQQDLACAQAALDALDP